MRVAEMPFLYQQQPLFSPCWVQMLISRMFYMTRRYSQSSKHLEYLDLDNSITAKGEQMQAKETIVTHFLEKKKKIPAAITLHVPLGANYIYGKLKLFRNFYTKNYMHSIF